LNYTSFLFAQPSFLSGAARTLDLAGVFDGYNECPNGATADRVAFWADAMAVGQDMRAALRSLAIAAGGEQEIEPVAR
jgi:hypothetical protein